MDEAKREAKVGAKVEAARAARPEAMAVVREEGGSAATALAAAAYMAVARSLGEALMRAEAARKDATAAAVEDTARPTEGSRAQLGEARTLAGEPDLLLVGVIQVVERLNPLVVFHSRGTEVRGDAVQTADEVVLMQEHSKTDPNGRGSVANAFEAPGNALCLVGLSKHAQRLNLGLFASSESFLLTQSNGKVLHRDVVAKNLSEAAVALGAPAGAASVISLRAGGASAMWDQGLSSEDIKRRGRWSSDCYQIYIWPGHDRARDVAARMLGSSFSLMASLAAYRRHD